MLRTHLIRLYPNKKQEALLTKTVGAVRFCWNWGLAKWDEMYKRGEKCNQYILDGIWTKERPDWSKEVYRDAQTRALLNLGGAYVAFFQKKQRHPTFHKRGRHDSFSIAGSKLRFTTDYKVALPKIGDVRMAEKLRYSGRIMQCTVLRKAGRWFITISVEIPDVDKRKSEAGSLSAVGVDVGAKHWAFTSDGETLDRPQKIVQLTRRLKHLQRAIYRRKKDSKNRAKARLAFERMHVRISNIKSDAMHKFTSRLVKNHDLVCCENLCVEGMRRGLKHMGVAIQNSCHSGLRAMLAYKAQHYVEIDRFFPSTRTCSRCGAKMEKLPLSKRSFVCSTCGYEINRDFNAAINIRNEGLRVFTEGHSGSACGGCGSSVKVPLQNGASVEAGSAIGHVTAEVPD